MAELEILVFLLLMMAINVSCNFPPVTTIILRQNKNWTSISCPNNVTSEDNTLTNIAFDCRLVERDKSVVSLPYHISLFPVLESDILDCTNLDNCLKLELKQDFQTVAIRARLLKPCLVVKMLFKIELRQGNKLIWRNSVSGYFSRKPPQPQQLHVVHASHLFSIDASAMYTCTEDLDGLRYVLIYQLNVKGCSASNVTECTTTTTKTSSKRVHISCRMPDACHVGEDVCSSRIIGRLRGTNKLGQQGELSNKISTILAYTERKSTRLKLKMKSLRSLTFSFNSPVNCMSSFSQFQYRFSHRKTLGRSDMVHLHSIFCTKDTCSFSINELEMGTSYNVCLSYKNVFDFPQFYSEPVCAQASTGQLPCHAPIITNLTHKAVPDTSYWKGGIHWRRIARDCWKEEVRKWQHYMIHLTDGNTSMTFNKSWHENTSSDGLHFLLYDQKYTLILSSCNRYGCVDGPKSIIFLKRTTDPSKPRDGSNQSLIETILICILSLLFLIATTILYCVVKNRKYKMKLERIRAEFVNNRNGTGNETVTFSRDQAGEADRAVESDELDEDEEHTLFHERHMIQVDTRHLVSHRLSLPENSTLV